jgi:hypothetical protein
MLSSMKKRPQAENTRDELKALLMKEEMVDSLID